jgi:serine/threonine-protein kinase
VPIGFDAWFARAVARDIEQRFQSAREMIDALREALGLELDRGSDPDIVVSSVQTPLAVSSKAPSSKRVPNSHVPTVIATIAPTEELAPASSVQAQSGRHTGADGNAPTLIADVPEDGALENGSALLDLPPEPTRSPLVPVFGVALGALGIGLVAGFLVLDREEPAATPTVTPGLAPVRSSEVPRVKSAAPKKKAQDLPPLASAPEVGTEAPAPSASAAPAKDGRLAAPAPAASAAKPAASSSAAPAQPTPPGSTWVKPAWAIPDEDPIRRAPVEE